TPHLELAIADLDPGLVRVRGDVVQPRGMIGRTAFGRDDQPGVVSFRKAPQHGCSLEARFRTYGPQDENGKAHEELLLRPGRVSIARDLATRKGFHQFE